MYNLASPSPSARVLVVRLSIATREHHDMNLLLLMLLLIAIADGCWLLCIRCALVRMFAIPVRKCACARARLQNANATAFACCLCIYVICRDVHIREYKIEVLPHAIYDAARYRTYRETEQSRNMLRAYIVVYVRDSTLDRGACIIIFLDVRASTPFTFTTSVNDAIHTSAQCIAPKAYIHICTHETAEQWYLLICSSKSKSLEYYTPQRKRQTHTHRHNDTSYPYMGVFSHAQQYAHMFKITYLDMKCEQRFPQHT